MPAENFQSKPGVNSLPHDEWRQLAYDAPNRWDLGHPGVRKLYENHVVPQLCDRGLGHLAFGSVELPGGSYPGAEVNRMQPDHGPTRISVEQEGEPTTVAVTKGFDAQQRVVECRDTDGNDLDKTVESEATPEDSADRLEFERRMNTGKNLHVLKKRFGERFVKGDLMEGGGYTDGGARELLAKFIELPPQKFPGAGFTDNEGRDLELSFAGVLKRIIPNKEGAYTLLKDNLPTFRQCSSNCTAMTQTMREC
ncbi:MAG: hypothetical protein WAQ25_01935 [Candidatus Saccharimonas sp.]